MKPSCIYFFALATILSLVEASNDVSLKQHILAHRSQREKATAQATSPGFVDTVPGAVGKKCAESHGVTICRFYDKSGKIVGTITRDSPSPSIDHDFWDKFRDDIKQDAKSMSRSISTNCRGGKCTTCVDGDCNTNSASRIDICSSRPFLVYVVLAAVTTFFYGY